MSVIIVKGTVGILGDLTNASDHNSTGILPELFSDFTRNGLIFLFSITAFLAIGGNTVAIFVFAFGRRLSRIDLRPFLINLAISDLIMGLFCIPFTFFEAMVREWLFPKPFCTLVLFMQVLSVSSSVFTNMAIGVDRFIGVVDPLRDLRRKFSSTRARHLTLVVIWICSVALASVQLSVGRAKTVGLDTRCREFWDTEQDARIYTLCIFVLFYAFPLISLTITYSIVGIYLRKRASPGNVSGYRLQLMAKRKFHVATAVDLPDGGLMCEESWPSLAARRTYTICLFVITYVIPLSILSITYTIVGILLWKRTAPGNRDQARDLHQLRSKRKVVKMLVIVVAMFGVCWLPLHLFIIVLDFHPEIPQTTDMKFLTSVFISCHWLAMSNSFANPIIYGFTNESFRADLVTLFYMWFPCCVCLTKMLPRHSSGSTYETVVFRRQSLYRQGAKGTLTYQQYRATIRATRNANNTLQVNGHRNRFDYQDMPDQTRLSPRSNGRVTNVRDTLKDNICKDDRDISYQRLKPQPSQEDNDNSISDDSLRSVGETEAVPGDKVG